MTDPTTHHRRGLAQELASARLAMQHALSASADRRHLRPLLIQVAIDAASAIHRLQLALRQGPMTEHHYV